MNSGELVQINLRKMEKYTLGKGEGETLLGEKDDGYTVYKNPLAIKEEIANFEIDIGI